jgi:acetoin utilization deacetylase AcuC-like enzyme
MSPKVGIVRDDRYLLHQPGLVHPDHPDRLRAIYEMLDREFGDTVATIHPELATLEDLELVHAPNYISSVLRTAERRFTYLAADTPVNSQSYLSAYLAVGGCIKGLQTILSGRCDACFALVRPPGHHALPNRASGFCVFNNLGVAAQYALSRHGVERILIVDWDIHHGNGIQQIFYEKKEVLYFSSHVLGWFPRTGHSNETGEGEGAGYTINVELPRDIEDGDFVALYRSILEPVMRRYRPELVMVAAGFDGHHMDSMGGTGLTQACFGNLAQLLVGLGKTVNDPPILLALEGGYDVTALPACVKEVLFALVKDEAIEMPELPMSPKIQQLFEAVRRIHSKFGVWV